MEKDLEEIKMLVNLMDDTKYINRFISLLVFERDIDLTNENYLKLKKIYQNYIDGENCSILNNEILEYLENTEDLQFTGYDKGEIKL